jgi:hypothetical protein
VDCWCIVMWSSGGRHVVEFDGVVNLGGLGSEDVAIPVLARHPKISTETTLLSCTSCGFPIMRRETKDPSVEPFIDFACEHRPLSISRSESAYIWAFNGVTCKMTSSGSALPSPSLCSSPKVRCRSKSELRSSPTVTAPPPPSSLLKHCSSAQQRTAPPRYCRPSRTRNYIQPFQFKVNTRNHRQDGSPILRRR